MSKNRLEFLFFQLYEQKISAREKEELMTLVVQNENLAELNQLIDRVMRNGSAQHHLEHEEAEQILSAIFQAATSQEADTEGAVATAPKLRILPVWARGLVAACIGAVVLYGAYRWHNAKKDAANLPIAVIKTVPDVAPGGSKAQLILANGNTIDLTTITNGDLTGQPGTTVNRLKGEVIYKSGIADENPKKAGFNTLRTPLGGEYKVVLPDGSQAWLNAASSLTFPTSFSGLTRKVEMSGEIYFEIKPDKNSPFIVKTTGSKEKNMEITVLGTHFNISSYNDEPRIQTTLLEGSVKVRKGGFTKVLVPGQQALVNAETKRGIEISTVDTESVVAWKEGRFEFNGSIKDIMRQISRWYDLDVEYIGNVGDKSFAGAISRKKNVSEVLKMLEMTGGIRFAIDNRKVIVSSTN